MLCCQSLGLGPFETKRAMCFANDVFVTRLCLCIPADEIAAVSVYLTTKGSGEQMVLNFFKISRETLERTVSEIKLFYSAQSNLTKKTQQKNQKENQKERKE